MRFASVILLAACLAAPAFADIQGAESVPTPPSERPAYNGQEPGIYRFGATYNTLAGSTPSACQSSCSNDLNCVSWSYVSPIGEAKARCELKRGGGKVVHNMSAVSGISARHEAKYAPAPAPVLRTSSTVLSGGPTSAGTVIYSAPTIVSSPSQTTSSTTTTTTTRTVRYPAQSQASEGRVTVPLSTAPVNTNTTVTYEAPKPYYPNADQAEGGKSTSYYPDRARIVVGDPDE